MNVILPSKQRYPHWRPVDKGDFDLSSAVRHPTLPSMKKRKGEVIPPIPVDGISGSWAPSNLTDDDVTPNDWAKQGTAEPLPAQCCRKHQAPLRMQKTTLPSGDEIEVPWCDNCGTPAP